MCTHVYACVCMCMHVYACVCMCMHVYACVCMCMHVHACVCMCMYNIVYYACVRVCVHVHTVLHGVCVLLSLSQHSPTIQAQTQLREVTEERDQLATQLQERTTSLEQFRGMCLDHESDRYSNFCVFKLPDQTCLFLSVAENVRVHDRVAQLEDELRELTHQYDETQLRLRHLTEYFEQKEHSLHR